MTKTDSVDEAIARLSHADPLPKLLQEIKLGRVHRTDAGLQAIVESWLDTYLTVLSGAGAWRLDQTSVRRLDPLPRLELLHEAGVIPHDHPSAARLREAYQQILTALQARATGKAG